MSRLVGLHSVIVINAVCLLSAYKIMIAVYDMNIENIRLYHNQVQVPNFALVRGRCEVNFMV